MTATTLDPAPDSSSSGREAAPGKPGDFPGWLVPMAATLTEDRFTGPDWLFERKLDGIRLLAFKRGPDVTLYSRNQLPQHIPKVARAVAELPVREAILDGEILWEMDAYHVFDVMWLDGRDLRQLPLDARRAELERLPLAPPLWRVPELDHPRPWERAREEGWEGVIAKRRDSPYEHRRSPHWLKMKCEATQELVVGGFTEPRGTRVGLGALLVGHFDGPDLVFAGKVGTGTGFDRKALAGLRSRLDAIETPTTPFTRAVGLPSAGVHWVRPEVVVQVAFIEWTVHDKLRHPRLVAVRSDEEPRDVVRERPRTEERPRRGETSPAAFEPSTAGGRKMPRHRVFAIEFAKVYPMYVQKAERKNRTKDEVDQIIRWLTGYSQAGLEKQIEQRSDLETFFAQAPAIHPNASLIKGVICGVRVEEIEDPLMQKIRFLDKLIDELAKGKAMEKILR